MVPPRGVCGFQASLYVVFKPIIGCVIPRVLVATIMCWGLAFLVHVFGTGWVQSAASYYFK